MTVSAARSSWLAFVSWFGPRFQRSAVSTVVPKVPTADHLQSKVTEGIKASIGIFMAEIV